MDFSKLSYGLIKMDTRILKNLYIDFSKLLNRFVKIDIWISLSVNMEMTKWIFLVVTWIRQSCSNCFSPFSKPSQDVHAC